jgi:hypothetical protein
MDRDELDDRIRFRRPGDAPFRRGMGAAGPAGEGGYEPFRPEPEDALAVRPAAPDIATPRVDHTSDHFDAEPATPPPPTEEPEEPTAPAARFEEPVPTEPIAAFVPPPPIEPVAPAPSSWSDEPRHEPEPPRYEPEEPLYEYGPYDGGYQGGGEADEPRGGSFGPLAVVAVVALALMAIGLGAILSGVFSGVASATPSPTPQASVAPSTSPTLAPTPTVSSTLLPTPTPSTTAGPVVFADGFTAQTQPCADQPDSFSGCNSSGSTVSGSSIWVWVGFRKGNDADVITASIIDAAGTTLKDGSVSLSTISCGTTCNGWLRFRFSGLAPGSYGIRIDRNGQLAAQSSFTVTG